jgi:hypothetical protein
VRTGRPLNEQELTRHFQGRQTIGMYVMNERGLCRFAAFDDDRLDGLEQLQEIKTQLARDGYLFHLEDSRRGGHLWGFFDQPVPASQVRDWFLPYCPPGVEFYPKQNEGGGYGSLIRLPFGVHRVSGQRYSFLQADGPHLRPVASTLSGQLTWLDGVERIPVPPERLHPLQFQRRGRTQGQSLAKATLPQTSCSHGAIHAWCEQQDPFSLIGSLVPLNTHGLGCCPFGEHHQHRTDQRPSFKVYPSRRPGGSCWYCYTWERGGNVFDFLCLYYHVSAREMWRRLQIGVSA